VKISIYTKQEYALPFGSDLIFIDLEVKITKIKDGTKEDFSLEIVKCSISPSMGFASYLVSLLPLDALSLVHMKIMEFVTEDLTPQLYSLYYEGVIQ